jgi:hypothetical protein
MMHPLRVKPVDTAPLAARRADVWASTGAFECVGKTRSQPPRPINAGEVCVEISMLEGAGGNLLAQMPPNRVLFSCTHRCSISNRRSSN